MRILKNYKLYIWKLVFLYFVTFAQENDFYIYIFLMLFIELFSFSVSRAIKIFFLDRALIIISRGLDFLSSQNDDSI